VEVARLPWANQVSFRSEGVNPRLVGKSHIATFGVFLLASFASSGAASGAGVCDLRAGLRANTTCGIGQGLFATDEVNPSGTGTLDSFLRLQQSGSERGYNGDGQTINNIDYRGFFLDINQPGTTSEKQSFISLDQLAIYVSDTGALTPYGKTANSAPPGALTGATSIYDMDTAAPDNYVQLDYSLSTRGSGSNDMVFYVPDSLVSGGQYVYLYSQFGRIDNDHDKDKSKAALEEWYLNTASNPIPTPLTAVPEPATLALLGTGLAAAWRRRKMTSVT